MSSGTVKHEAQQPGEYQVLARRYRSRGFDEVVGQASIANTLKNAIARNRTAHAYLFCGTRGVGKTSMARIFATALNATEDLTEREAIAAAILRGEDMDVIEIDAASNNGVADARDLISNAGLMPARCRWKIYIIDEVHMLSVSAFNALLKTMEEPPSHVKFILCTTDPHKVLPTIQSRCQRFDFRPIAAPLIAGHMKSVLEKEGVEAEDGVLTRLSLLANGSMRDGLSLLDRLIAAADDRLDSALLESSLGLVPAERIDAIVVALGEGDAAEVLRASQLLLDEGLSIEQALNALAERFRTLLAASVCGADEEVLGLGQEAAEASVAQAAAFDSECLIHLIALCDSLASKTRYSGAARAVFDAGMVRMALAERFADAASLLKTGDATAGAKKKRPVANPSPVKRVTPPKRAVVEPKPKLAAKTTPPPSPEGVWERLIQAAVKPMDRAMLDTLEFDAFEALKLTLRVRRSAGSAAGWFRSRPESLHGLVKRALGPGILVEILDSSSAATPSPATVDESIRQHEIVQEAMELFDATLVDGRPPINQKPES